MREDTHSKKGVKHAVGLGTAYLQLCALFLEEAVLLLLVHVTACQPVVLLLQSLQLTCQLHNLQCSSSSATLACATHQ